jgi:hypothetical protein
MLKGKGTVNGSGVYHFLLAVKDIGTSGVYEDQFRIKITEDGATEAFYDNQRGASDSSYDGSLLFSGNIKIHKKDRRLLRRDED